MEGNNNSKRFVIKLAQKRTATEIKNNSPIKYSKLVVSIDCLTEKENELSPAGPGRSDPN